MKKATTTGPDDASGNRSRPLDAVQCVGMDDTTKQQRQPVRRKKPRLPKMGRHSSGQARVALGGKVYYLGEHGSAEAHARYAALMQQWRASGGVAPQRAPHATQATLTVRTLCEQYREWIDATGRYMKNGAPTSQRHLVDDTLRKFEAFAGDVRAAKLGEAVLVQWRDRLEKKVRVTRRGINRQVSLVLRMLKWARSRGLLPREAWGDCCAIEPLKRGECGARPERVRERRAVTLDEIERVACALEAPVDVNGTEMPGNRQVAEMLRLQAVLGCRPGEVCAIRWADIDKAPIVVDGVTMWTYRVPDAKGKTAHHGRSISYPVPPAAQRILERQPPTLPSVPIFSALRSMAERGRARIDAEGFAEQWSTRVYRVAVARAAAKAGVPYFCTHEVRHGALSRAAASHGLLAAQRLANHSSPSTTAGYLHADDLAAYRVAASMK